jgi:hypothetical protein
LSRFSYLRVLTKGPTGARYVLSGMGLGELRAQLNSRALRRDVPPEAQWPKADHQAATG